jgi:hypothetical protein
MVRMFLTSLQVVQTRAVTVGFVQPRIGKIDL